jgi:ribosomal protein S18 acetylase RimI-like enzyme
MITRIATKNDLQKIVNLHIRSWRENYQKSLSSTFLSSDMVNENRLATWTDRLSTENDKQRVIIAEIDSAFAGFVCSYLDKQYGTLIDNLHVEPTFRRQSVGTALMNQAAIWIQQQRPTTPVYLEVYAENDRARKFYLGIGGKLITEKPAEVQAVDGGKTLSYHIRWDTPSILQQATQQRGQVSTLPNLTSCSK